MCEASSVARKRAVPASSAGPGMRFIGVSDRSWSPRPDCQSLRPRVASVSINPGAKTLTRTVGANACAYDLVTPRIPYFAAAYCGEERNPGRDQVVRARV